jgi:hypothetical protein
MISFFKVLPAVIGPLGYADPVAGRAQSRTICDGLFNKHYGIFAI